MDLINVGQQAQNELRSLFRELFVNELKESFNNTGEEIRDTTNNFTNSVKGKIERLIEEQVFPLSKALESIKETMNTYANSANNLRSKVDQAIIEINTTLNKIHDDLSHSCLNCNSKISALDDELKSLSFATKVDIFKILKTMVNSVEDVRLLISKQKRLLFYLGISQTFVIVFILLFTIIR